MYYMYNDNNVSSIIIISSSCSSSTSSSNSDSNNNHDMLVYGAVLRHLETSVSMLRVGIFKYSMVDYIVSYHSYAILLVLPSQLIPPSCKLGC